MSDRISTVCSSDQQGFTYVHNTSRGEGSAASHVDRDLFSIFTPISGELDYIVEGQKLHLKPGDLLIIGNNEMHQSVLKKDAECEYILLMIHLDFFIKHNCTELSDLFLNRTLGTNNVFSAEQVVESGIYDIITRLEKYTSAKEPSLVVVSSVIIELLYNLNLQIEKSDKPNYKHEKIKEVIDYINDNLTSKLSLEDIASRFYIKRQYLCKLFKQATGFTVNKYISYKRIVLVREYYLKGMSLSVACEKAGFSDYSSFYRAYSNIMNESPRKGMSDSFF